MMEHDLFNDYPETPKDELEGLPIEERIEILKQRHFEKEAEKAREEEEREQAIIQAKKDKEYKEYTSKIERFFKWMIGFTLFAIVSVGYLLYKDYFLMTVHGGVTIAGETKELGKDIVAFLFSIIMCFFAPALLPFFVEDMPEEKGGK
jgi:hypothetical protein